MRTHNEKEALDKKLEKAEAEAAATEAAAQAETAAREAAEAEEAAAKAVAAHDAEARKEARRSFSEESHVPREVEEEAVPEGTEAIPAAISAPDKERFATPPAGFDTPTATISTATTAAVAGGDALAAGDEMAGGAAAVSRQRQAATSRSDDKLPGRAAPPPSSAVQSSMSEPAKDKEPQVRGWRHTGCTDCMHKARSPPTGGSLNTRTRVNHACRQAGMYVHTGAVAFDGPIGRLVEPTPACAPPTPRSRPQ